MPTVPASRSRIPVLRAAALTAGLLLARQSPALDVIDPTGVEYVNVSDSSHFNASFVASNLFTYDVTGQPPGSVLGGGEYAKSGSGTAYVAFELDAVYPVGSVFFAQRLGSTTGDNMQRMSIWASDTTTFTAADPGTLPVITLGLRPNAGAPIWEEYILTNALAGRYFLLKLEQTTVTGNPGGNELRFGLAPVEPVIAVPPTAQSVYSGNTATFSAQAAGTLPLVYQWQAGPVGMDLFTNLVDVGNITGAQSGNLTLANVPLGDLDYRVVVTNNHGSATSAPVTLTVTTSAPQITTDVSPASLQQPSGYAFSLSVGVEGSRPMSFQWKRGGISLEDGDRILGAHSNVLTVANAKAEDAGEYQLFVHNDFGDGSSSLASVTVIPSLPVLDPTGALYSNVSASSQFNAGFVAATLFTFNVTSLPPGATLTGNEYAKKGSGTAWVAFQVDSVYTIGSIYFAQRNGSGTGDNMQKLSVWTSETTAFTAADPGTAPAASLALLPNSGTPVWREYFLTNNLNGRYFLLKLEQTTLTGNPGGNEMRLGLAQQVPTIVAAPTNRTVYSGNTVELPVQAAGAPPLKYQWQSSPVGAGNFSNLANSANVSGATSATLILRNVPLTDMDYRVVVTNNFGAATSAPPATLSVVTSGPQIVQDVTPASLQQPAGYAFSLAVAVEGSTPINYQWKHNGASLSDGDRIHGARSNILTVSDSRPDDAGSYQLFMDNSYGNSASSQAAVSVESTFGFHDGSAWTLNGGAAVAAGVLTLTDGGSSQSRTAFFNDPVPVDAFVATFTYRDLSIGGADGVAFVLQNAPAGPAAVGAGGSGLGIQGVSPSAAIALNIYAPAPGGVGFAFVTNGATAGNGGDAYSSTAPVNLAGGNPIGVAIRYAASALSLTFTDAIAGVSFTTNLPVNLPVLVGSTEAYLGFSGATGGVASHQEISEVSYTHIPTLSVGRQGNDALSLTWPAGGATFKLQYNSDLDPANWVNEPTPVLSVNGQNQVTITPLQGNRFYRLALP